MGLQSFIPKQLLNVALAPQIALLPPTIGSPIAALSLLLSWPRAAKNPTGFCVPILAAVFSGLALTLLSLQLD